MKVLVLAGTEEARKLCHELRKTEGLEVVGSLFQETLNSTYPVPVITGGYGGVEGLIEYIQNENINLLIDATHPFSEKINSNALLAARKTGTEYIRLIRPKWEAGSNDRWLEFPTLLQACQNIPHNSRIFAALGGKNLGDIIDEIENILRSARIFLRVMEIPTFELSPNWVMLNYNLPITLESERNLLIKLKITHILCRNSGGKVSRLKLKAAAELGLDVFMVDRPSRLEGYSNSQTYPTVEALLQSRFAQPNNLFESN